MQRQVVEYAGVPVGILVPDSDRLKFIAVKFHVHDLDENGVFKRLPGRRIAEPFRSGRDRLLNGGEVRAQPHDRRFRHFDHLQ